MTRFALLRHGETLANREKTIQGQTDSPLTRQARAWAADAGGQLFTQGFSHILVSDLGRARNTADCINQSLNLPIGADLRLREQDWGDWTGRSVAEIRKEAPHRLAEMEAMGWDFRPPGGESRKQVLTRSLAALEDAALGHPEGSILVITHQGVIKCLVYHLLGLDFLPGNSRKLDREKPVRLIWNQGNLRLSKE